MAIVGFGDKKTEQFHQGQHVPAFSGFARAAERKLDQLDTAQSLADLAALPGNRLEALKGARTGQYSIRVNDQWRIVFRWPSETPGPIDVQIVDYH